MATTANSILKRLGIYRLNAATALRAYLPAMFSGVLMYIPATSLAIDKPQPVISKLNIAAIDIESQSLIDHWYKSLLDEQRLIPEVGKYSRNSQFSKNAAQAANDSLWLRLAEQKLLSTPSNEAVDNELKLYVDNKFWTERNLKDAGPYLHYVLSRLEARKLPFELALLPLIESSYNPVARSRLNAVGLWQLVPSTAKSLGLTINQWTDERKDIQKSTKAALDYLEQMYVSIGSWPLAIAAYNAGPSRIRARIKRVKKENVEVWDISLPNETRRYVAKFFALNELIRRSSEFSLKLPAIPRAPVFAEMHVNTRISLTAAAQLAELPVENLAIFNHDLLTSATPPNGPHSVVIPLQAKKTFQSNLDMAIRKSVVLFRPTFYHTVVRGESLSVIAAKHRLSISEIQELNKLKGTKIRSGQKILLVSMDDTQSESTATPEHKVRKGDTLSGIASMYGVRRSIIAKTNNINNDDMLRIGKILIIPARYIPSNNKAMKYTVKSGDTLSEIAELFKVPLFEIKRLNPPLADAHTILPGQNVFIPKNTY